MYCVAVFLVLFTSFKLWHFKDLRVILDMSAFHSVGFLVARLDIF